MDAEGDVLTPSQLRSMFVEMQIGGFENTRMLLSGGLYALLGNRSQWEKLVADPTLVGNAVEELLRFVTPGQWTGRIALHDTEIAGVEVAADEAVIPLLASADRDPAVFPDPDTLDIARPNAKQHVALGLGRHYCLGASLARLEGRIFFGTLASRYPEMELVTEEPTWVGSAVNRRLASLEVSLGPRRAGAASA
jgi:cytochrome P450